VFPEEDEDFMARVQRSAQQEVEQADAGHEATSKDSDTAEQPMEEEAEPGPEGDLTGDGPTVAVAPTGKQTLGDSVESEGVSRTQELEAELQRYYQGPAIDMGMLIEVSKRAAG
jgi:hypothetical protein